tara:strand:- start:11029 stop:12144 length:1116 start_codon:yes stop_codon:yes gene_type:complete
MFRIFYAEKDTTLYESFPDYNTGIDEVLEIGKRLNTEGNTLLKSRSLIKFDMNEISSSLATYGKTVNDCKFMLQLYTTHAKNLPSDYSIYAKLVGQNWINGTGYLSELTIDGATWSGSASGSNWISGSQSSRIGSSNLYVSGSGSGGNYMYYSGSGNTLSLIASESFSYSNTDVNMNVTDALKIWLSGSNSNTIPNYGFLLQLADPDESSISVAGFIRFFSKETHTIYVPKLTMYFDTGSFITGSLTSANLESYIVYTQIKPEYKDTEIAKIRIYARDKFPSKSPTNVFPIQTVKYLPATTYYSIMDAATNEVIIPYDNIYTKVNCDSTSNFIYIDMNGFMPERYYRLQLKLIDGFTTNYIDDNIYFKVVR